MDEDKICEKFDIDLVEFDEGFSFKRSDPEDVYELVVEVNDHLTELQLRQQHNDLQLAWDKYQELLDKYKFWDQFK